MKTRITDVARIIIALLLMVTIMLALPYLAQAFSTAQQVALNRVNYYRGIAGLSPVTLNDILCQSAANHANYYMLNVGDPSLKGVSPHEEVQGKPGYTGNIRDRVNNLGMVDNVTLAEDIHFVADPSRAVDDWVNSVYHRIYLLNPDTYAIGYGSTTRATNKIDVLDMALAIDGQLKECMYPAPNQKHVPVKFEGREIPNPAPNAVYPIGYPITYTVNNGDITLSSITLKDKSNRFVDSYVIKPGDNYLPANSVAILAKKPLLKGSVYTVDIQGCIGNQPLARSWSFCTASTPEVKGIEPSKGIININKLKTLTIVFSQAIKEGSAYKSIELSKYSSKKYIKLDLVKKISGDKLLLTPKKGFEYGVAYKIVVPASSVMSLSGDSFEQGYSVIIKTEKKKSKTKKK